jgi:phenylalanyl-tRNA synthetase beta subunit
MYEGNNLSRNEKVICRCFTHSDNQTLTDADRQVSMKKLQTNLETELGVSFKIKVQAP